ncbi:MAG: ATP-binding protein [Ketobacter sp.]|nr:MAG: ATP-binding protein [Ketobacter sp.]
MRSDSKTASIGRQLSFGLAASLVLGAVLLGVVATVLFERAVRNYALENLEYESRTVLTAIANGTQGVYLDDARLSPAYLTPFSGRYYVVEIEGERWRSRSLWDAELPVLTEPGPAPGLIDGPEHQRLLYLRSDFRRYGKSFSILVATDMAPLLAEFNEIGLLLLALGLAVVVVLIYMQYRVMRRVALRPLQQAQLQLQQLQRGERELLDSEAPLELQPLIDEINRLLDYMRVSLLRSRNALGNLGHALKTPLAVLISVAERADPQLRETLQHQLAQMQRRITRELGRARTAGEVRGGEHFNPREVVPLLLDSLERAHRRELTYDWQVPAGTLPLEHDDMLELLGNLLDNSCKWAQTQVRLRIECPHSQILIRIEDDGPGIAETQYDEALARGGRLDEQMEGHGLGLGIAQDIIAAYHGELELARSSLGGLSVSVCLPLIGGRGAA